MSYKSFPYLKHAFTLLEMLLVIAVVAVFAVIAVIAINPAGKLEAANRAKRLNNIDSIEKAIDSYLGSDRYAQLPTLQQYSGIDLASECPTCQICLTSAGCTATNLPSVLVPNFLNEIPKNPNFSSSTQSGYYIFENPTGAVNIVGQITNGYVNNNGTEFISYKYLGTEASILSKFTAQSLVLDGGVNVFSDNRQAALVSSTDIFPVDPAMTYNLEGEFKSIGGVQSMMYFGIIPYDSNKNYIWPYQVLRTANEVTVSSFNSSQIVTSPAPSGWYNSGSQAHQRTLGFYYDGNTNKAPDYVIYNGTSGAYASYTGSTITLTAALPSQVSNNIVLGTTKIMNHMSGASYLYFGGSNVTIPTNWTEFTGTITGEHSMGTEVGWKFRNGTRYASVMILVNYNPASTDETMLFKNLKFGAVIK